MNKRVRNAKKANNWRTAVFKFYFEGKDLTVYLPVGESATFSFNNPHEEGYCYGEYNFYNNGTEVEKEYICESSDCDGNYSRQEDYYCELTRLHSVPNYYGELRPDWKKVGRGGFRDYRAESMGY